MLVAVAKMEPESRSAFLKTGGLMLGKIGEAAADNVGDRVKEAARDLVVEKPKELLENVHEAAKERFTDKPAMIPGEAPVLTVAESLPAPEEKPAETAEAPAPQPRLLENVQTAARELAEKPRELLENLQEAELTKALLEKVQTATRELTEKPKELLGNLQESARERFTDKQASAPDADPFAGLDHKPEMPSLMEKLEEQEAAEAKQDAAEMPGSLLELLGKKE